MISSRTRISGGGSPPTATAVDDEALSARLRDLALVDLDTLVAGAAEPQVLVAAYADDVADALTTARARLAALRAALAGPDPLQLVDLSPRQRAAEPAAQAAVRTRERLVDQAATARAIARLSELAAQLLPSLLAADRRR